MSRRSAVAAESLISGALGISSELIGSRHSRPADASGRSIEKRMMKTSVVRWLLALGVVVGASFPSRALALTLTVDRTDDTATATACTGAPNDCSLRGAIIAANADAGADPVVINLQPA